MKKQPDSQLALDLWPNDGKQFGALGKDQPVSVFISQAPQFRLIQGSKPLSVENSVSDAEVLRIALARVRRF